MSLFDDELNAALEQRVSESSYRQRFVNASAQGSTINLDGKNYLNFSSNDYLGFASHHSIAEACQNALNRYGVGSGASHLVYGHSDCHHRLEEDIATFTGRERALLFSTGYMANLGVITALADRNATVYEDRLNHASLIDGALLSRANFKRYKHNDLAQLEAWLARDKSSRKLVVTDGVFSMDGDLAPLPDLARLCAMYQAQLVVDDAHGFGVLGQTGGGCAEYFQLSAEQLPVLIGTFGKAFGTFGAFVAGSNRLIETLIQFARSYIYTTALPPAIAAATSTSISLVKSASDRRQGLYELIDYFRTQAKHYHLPLMDSITPIQPLLLGANQKVIDAAQQLREQGILVGAIRPPTVPENTARLRITLNSSHSKEHIDTLVQTLLAEKVTG